MKSFLKLALKYWLYNQLFFLGAIIIAIISAFLCSILIINGTSYAYIFLFSMFVIIGLILLKQPFKFYWFKTLNVHNESLAKLSCASLLPCSVGGLAFAFFFYSCNGSMIDLLSSLYFYLLLLIHGSFLILLLVLLYNPEYIILFFLITNLIPLAFFASYIYKICGVKLPLFKPAACVVAILAICGSITNYTIENGITVRSHKFAYENGLSSVDLSKYKITNPNNILPKLNEPSTLLLTQDEWLTLDGAEAAYPVYSAFANACYDGIQKYQYNKIALTGDEKDKINTEFKKYVAFNNTVYAFKDLINKRCDVFFGAMPSQKQQEEAAALGEELVLTPIAGEAFVFL